jgi:hypothetical protein
MAIDFSDDVVAEMETEQKRAAARSSAGSASWFMLKDGEKALVRCLLNLNQVASVLKHDFWNPSTRKFEVNALCARSLDLDADQCAHCVTARTNKKLSAQKYFIVPLYVYGVKNSAGQPVSYVDQEGNEKAVEGLKYLQLKASSDILATLLAMYRDGANLTTMDLKITRAGAGTDTRYTVLPQPPSTFAVVGIPAQDRESIIQRIADLNPPDIAGFPPALPASNGTPAAAKTSIPDF